jgi:hypothetical protein
MAHPIWKQPRSEAETTGEKITKSISQPPAYDDKKAAWRISKIQLADPYGWHEMTPSEVSAIRVKLATFEKNTWKELFIRDAKWNHRIQSGDLKCPIAKAWMKTNMPDQPFLWTLRLSGAERVWGILSEGAFLIVFWDPNHLIWEIPRR